LNTREALQVPLKPGIKEIPKAVNKTKVSCIDTRKLQDPFPILVNCVTVWLKISELINCQEKEAFQGDKELQS
jgi:hypothetical protein